jgi:hypothetical protein
MNETYWREIGVEGGGAWPESAMTNYAMHNGKWEPVAVVPVADLARLRAMEARLGDDELFDATVALGMQGNGHPTNCVCHTCAEDASREHGASAYRRAVLGEDK